LGSNGLFTAMVLKMLQLYAGGKSFENLNTGLQTAYNAWTTSPTIGSFHIVADLPALFIIVLTALVYRGMKESEMLVT
jgi:hypothetical protein